MDELRREILESHIHDLPVIRQYIRWVKFRRLVYRIFYFQAHWVKPEKLAHWVGK